MVVQMWEVTGGSPCRHASNNKVSKFNIKAILVYSASDLHIKRGAEDKESAWGVFYLIAGSLDGGRGSSWMQSRFLLLLGESLQIFIS